MTISTTETRISYSGNGSTTAFSFPYRFLLNSDLIVVVTDSSGVETTQTITTHYSITGAGDDAGGTVTMVTAPASGETLTIYRSVPITQETDYIEGDTFPAETHEDALDKLTMIDQQNNEFSRRSIKIPVSSTVSSAELTQLPEDRPNYYVRVNSAGDAFELVAPTAAQTNSSVVSEVHTATASQTSFSLSNSYSEGINHLRVYINGVKQQPNTSYTETDSTTVDFSEGLDAGDVVEFLIGILEPNNVASAANVSYTPEGEAATDVQTEMREITSIIEGTQEATGTFTIEPDYASTTIDSSGGAVTGTLGSATRIGHIHTLVMTDASNSSTVSVTNHETSDPEVITFAAVDDAAVLAWTGTEWLTLKLSGATV